MSHRSAFSFANEALSFVQTTLKIKVLQSRAKLALFDFLEFEVSSNKIYRKSHALLHFLHQKRPESNFLDK